MRGLLCLWPSSAWKSLRRLQRHRWRFELLERSIEFSNAMSRQPGWMTKLRFNSGLQNSVSGQVAHRFKHIMLKAPAMGSGFGGGQVCEHAKGTERHLVQVVQQHTFGSGLIGSLQVSLERIRGCVDQRWGRRNGTFVFDANTNQFIVISMQKCFRDIFMRILDHIRAVRLVLCASMSKHCDLSSEISRARIFVKLF